MEGSSEENYVLSSEGLEGTESAGFQGAGATDLTAGLWVFHGGSLISGIAMNVQQGTGFDLARKSKKLSSRINYSATKLDSKQFDGAMQADHKTRHKNIVMSEQMSVTMGDTHQHIYTRQ